MKSWVLINIRRLVYRFRLGWRSAITWFISLVALTGAVLGSLAIADVTLSLMIIVLLFILCIFLSILFPILLKKLEHLPKEVIFNEDGDGTYFSRYCDSDGLKEANTLTKPFYRHEYVEDAIVEQWRLKNPYAFVQIMNSRNVLCASFGILAVEASFFRQFLKGRVIDNELNANDILGPDDSTRSSELYISGVVVRDPTSMIGHRRSCVMIWAMLEYLKKVYGFRKKRSIYALAVNASSESLLTRCGFLLSQNADARKDKLNLYRLDLNRPTLNTIYQRIGNYSDMCNCRYD